MLIEVMTMLRKFCPRLRDKLRTLKLTLSAYLTKRACNWDKKYFAINYCDWGLVKMNCFLEGNTFHDAFGVSKSDINLQR